MSVFADQVFLLARRSVVRTVRQPANVVAPLLFPMLLLAVNSGGLKAETRLPGFPTNSFVAFALAVPFIQGALFATMNAGTDLARDIQTGFLSRLSLTPMRGIALLAGQLGGDALGAGTSRPSPLLKPPRFPPRTRRPRRPAKRGTNMEHGTRQLIDTDRRAILCPRCEEE